MLTSLNHNNESVPPLENEDFSVDVENKKMKIMSNKTLGKVL